MTIRDNSLLHCDTFPKGPPYFCSGITMNMFNQIIKKMKPVVLILATAVLLLISVANHRHESCPEKRFSNSIQNHPKSLPEYTTDEKATTEYLSEPVEFSGKHINFFLSF
jgi:hypothetical protein